ncbi:unnamed protein product [Hydatigera taeniaeformis]|uniref:Secreted protein n=1 Tax=Hydatigena taeniaeformis TaxID=6205 RepID=A0A0R3XBQ7_HYDTA|nr:unnamed protein product [Hydatigera taeniaeformis]
MPPPRLLYFLTTIDSYLRKGRRADNTLIQHHPPSYPSRCHLLHCCRYHHRRQPTAEEVSAVCLKSQRHRGGLGERNMTRTEDMEGKCTAAKETEWRR